MTAKILRPILPLAGAVLMLAGAAGAHAQAVVGTGLTGIWRTDDEFVESNQKLVLPLTPAGLAVKAADKAKLEKGDVIGGSGKTCGPIGMPTMMVNEFALEFLEIPGLITILNEAATLPRHVYMDEKVHPAGQEPSYNGHSIGHWEGQSLASIPARRIWSSAIMWKRAARPWWVSSPSTTRVS